MGLGGRVAAWCHHPPSHFPITQNFFRKSKKIVSLMKTPIFVKETFYTSRGNIAEIRILPSVATFIFYGVIM